MKEAPIRIAFAVNDECMWDWLIAEKKRTGHSVSDVVRDCIRAVMCPTVTVGMPPLPQVHVEPVFKVETVSSTPESGVCSECGKPKDDTRHIKCGNDIDNPVKHEFVSTSKE